MGVTNRIGLTFFAICFVCIALLYFKEQLNPKIKITALKNVSQAKTFISPYVNRYLRINQGHTNKSVNGKTHHILWWNEPYWMKGDTKNCDMSRCEYGNCLVTEDKRYIDSSSAVLIAIVGPEAYKLPAKPSQRNPNQAWTFFTLESPIKFRNRVFGTDKWRNVFNWSMTYRRDADIFTPYGWLGDRKTSLQKNYSDIFRTKTRQVAWIVSHCSTSGKREEYVQELQKYIQVDIYGRCGSRVTNNVLYELLPKYKFYLGFENSLCKDYMTEKFFHYFMYDWIVVVRGLNDYGKFLPNNTFINTADFSSIKSLGQYLSRLSKDKGRYIEYLKEKDKYEVLGQRYTICDSHCSLCEKVNNIENNRHTYRNIFNWAGSCEGLNDIK